MSGFNEWYNIDDLPFSNHDKQVALEWLARKYWNILLKLEIQCGHCKMYDPLVIEGNVAHTYVFDLDDGGRHHPFENYKHLEKMMDEEMFRELKLWKEGDVEDE